MKAFLTVFQIVVSLLLILSILSQQRGSGLSLTFGGGGGGVYHSKRGAEKVLARLTIILAILFIASTLTFIFV